MANVKQELEGEARVSVKPPPTESTRTPPETFLLAALGQKCAESAFQKGVLPPPVSASPSETRI